VDGKSGESGPRNGEMKVRRSPDFPHLACFRLLPLLLLGHLWHFLNWNDARSLIKFRSLHIRECICIMPHLDTLLHVLLMIIITLHYCSLLNERCVRVFRFLCRLCGMCGMQYLILVARRKVSQSKKRSSPNGNAQKTIYLGGLIGDNLGTQQLRIRSIS